ncbi:hypothetical protein ACI1MP_37180 (plasmid) [Kitasatospora griseola]
MNPPATGPIQHPGGTPRAVLGGVDYWASDMFAAERSQVKPLATANGRV